ncbi:MAG: DUF3368 domain-containing protein [Verrucomicrobia bacterium]|nr:DUF3368 domain-containing protein [Verrucomicrobiota bacterium]
MNSNALEPLVICDASPLILLARLGHLHIIAALAEEIWIPQTVWDEVTHPAAPQTEIASLRALFAHCIVRADAALESAFRLQVDPGEASALALIARNPHGCLLIDDSRGRSIARQSGWRHIGTLGWLLRAKRAGLIQELRPLFEILRQLGWFIAPRLIEETLRAAGET